MATIGRYVVNERRKNIQGRATALIPLPTATASCPSRSSYLSPTLLISAGKKKMRESTGRVWCRRR